MARIRLITPFDIPPFSDLLRAAPSLAEEDERVLGHIDIDVLERPDAFVVDAELPGVRREEIHVTVDRNRVEISGKARPRTLAEGERMLCRERHEGLFFRSFALPQEVDAEAATARFADGVLELVLPKKGRGERALRIQ